jgi:hypothetical protein
MPSRFLWVSSAILSLALCTPRLAHGQEGTPTAPAATAPAAANPPGKPYCTGGAYEQFDFWVGDWRVTDSKSGELIAFERVQRINDGCTILQDFYQLNDQYQRPNSPVRLHGMSVSVFDGKAWRQVYFDNMGSYITTAGRLDDKGVMVLTGDLKPASPDEVKVLWESKPDGTLRNYGFRRSAGGEWKPFFDNTYHPNRPGK